MSPATDSPSPLAAAPRPLSRRLVLSTLAAILVSAGLLRLPVLDKLPPGLHQDEAVNAWNAYCLLKTGRDQFGVRWPVFYMRALGGNRSVLFTYLIMPFQALGGMNIWTTRLPVALGGLLTVLLLYSVGARLFDRVTGLVAAALLALNPVHIQMSRFGNEPSITPLLTLLPVAALLWAGLPLDDRQSQPRPGRALIAGLVTGVCCYGYAAVRLFLPLLLTGCVLVTWRAWRDMARTRRGVIALAGLVLALGVTFGPLAYEHVVHPEGIGRRGRATWVWSPTDSLAVRGAKVLDRYTAHFLPDFLFWRGDVDEGVWTPGFGFLPVYALPPLGIGLLVCLARLRSSRAARVVLLGVLLYPVGDSLNTHLSLQTLRSSAGLWLLILPAALGLTRAAALLTRQRTMAWSLAAAVVYAGLVIPEEARFLVGYVDRPRRMAVYQNMQVDLVEACAWLRPRLPDVDAVICTTRDFNHPYIITLVALHYDPKQWIRDPREFRPTHLWDRWVRYGKLYFPDEDERSGVLQQLRACGRPPRVIYILRENEPAPGEPVQRIVGPDGKTALLIYDGILRRRNRRRAVLHGRAHAAQFVRSPG